MRLKHQLRVSKDGEVAAALGLSKTAFSERKKRGSFPETELRALARDKPELGLDPDAVLFGVDAQVRHARENWRTAQTLARETLRRQIAAETPGGPTPQAEEPSPPALAGLTYDELTLLKHWRSCGSAERILLIQLAARLTSSGQ